MKKLNNLVRLLTEFENQPHQLVAREDDLRAQILDLMREAYAEGQANGTKNTMSPHVFPWISFAEWYDCYKELK